MANISYKASMTMTNRFGWNGGNEYEDEGELNYSNTFYRKYDAQIGRFTGVDMLAEDYADLTPYQFGANNPVMFNDPTGAVLSAAQWEQVIGTLWSSNYGGYSNENGMGNYFTSNDEAFGAGLASMDQMGGWGAYEGWATSAEDALERYISGNDASGGVKGYNYVTATFSASFTKQNYNGDNYVFNGRVSEEYIFAGYGNAFDASAIAAGYAAQTKPLKEVLLEATHTTLGALSFLPVIGTGAALLDAGIYTAQGDYKNAAWSAAAAIPFAKIATAGVKYGGLALASIGKVEQYALRATQSGFYPVMQRGFSKAQGLQYLEKGEVWKFGTTKNWNPFTRYTKQHMKGIGEGVKRFREFRGLGTDAIKLQNMKITNYVLQNGHLPPGNKIIN